MILSGCGTQSEFFQVDTATRLYKLPNLTKWYRAMGSEPFSRQVAERFIAAMRPRDGGASKVMSMAGRSERSDSFNDN